MNALLKPVPATVRRQAGHSAEAALFAAEDYIVLRTPLLPIDALARVSHESAAAHETSGLVPSGSTPTAEQVVAGMAELWRRPLMREAIYLASPSLHDRLKLWDFRLGSRKDHELAGALYNYLTRMSTRCTPFGLCAAVSLVRVEAHTQLDLAHCRLQRHTRLDTSVVAALCERLASEPTLRHRLPLRSNECGHLVGQRWHYVDWLLSKGLRVYTLSSVEASDVLMSVLQAATERHRTAPELAAMICAANPEIPQAAALAFIDSLIENRLLIAQLEPRITGSECLPAMLQTLTTNNAAGPAVAVLEQVQQRLARIDRQWPEAEPTNYQALLQSLQPLGAELDRQRLVQVDLYRADGGLTLSRAVADEIARAAELSLRLGASRANPLDDFCRRYRARYESRRMPLLQVLDPEIGIGDAERSADAGDLLAGVLWLGSPESSPSARLESLLLSRWRSAAPDGVEEIVLDPEDVPAFSAADRAAVAPSAHALATLLAADAQALDNGDYRIVLEGVLGPSAANMVGRFAFGSPELAERLRASLAAEAQCYPDAILAEIVHLPQERMGNLACRPLLREYEIPMLGSSGAAAAQQISLDDLDVEVRGNNVLLWSRRLRRRVIPRMSNAHNYTSNPLGLYRFLCMLQYQGQLTGRFQFPASLERLPRLPRVRCGRVILAPARWRVTAADAAQLLKADRRHIQPAMARLRQALGLPRLTGMIDGDSIQTLDLHDPFAIEALRRSLRKRQQVDLLESACDPGSACVAHGPDRYSHELIVPLRKRPIPVVRSSTPAARFDPAPPPAQSTIAAGSRDRLPGSDWLYLRLHGSPLTLDRLLAETLAPLAEQLRQEGLCSGWFYIRYGDPDWHLRLRFQGQPQRLLSDLLPRLHTCFDQLIAEQQLSRVEIGSYQRELERYGGPEAMALCEQWFAQESRRVASLLRLLRGGQRHWRWQCAAACLLGDLSDLGLGSAQLSELFEYLASGFKREFQMEQQRLASLGNKYRQTATAVQAACLGQLPADLPEPLRYAIDAVRAADRTLRQSLGAQLQALATEPGRLWGSVDQLLPSLVHMSCNRWFADNPRANEMVLYELIRRGLLATRARAISEADRTAGRG
jgi:thiopeptide-type bacteriocin biosynthesis protein